ncbi:uncharacterized protein LOC113283333 isoform X2 [Papaver somniferum]|uniref:uncharacterized protein LOC113283333 isoform X2 n=1 Tax=Papaver somniferum TaxID=3469 RepID=UPI000E702CE0|nr:uncharacterized protein LOC113283333 isoform X2 [Papaver somniferum]
MSIANLISQSLPFPSSSNASFHSPPRSVSFRPTGRISNTIRAITIGGGQTKDNNDYFHKSNKPKHPKQFELPKTDVKAWAEEKVIEAGGGQVVKVKMNKGKCIHQGLITESLPNGRTRQGKRIKKIIIDAAHNHAILVLYLSNGGRLQGLASFSEFWNILVDSLESGDQSIPDDGSKGTNRGKLDWRTVRAGFVARKEVLVVDSGSTPQEGGSSISSMPLGSKWSHPLSALENGCVLVATEKLDGVQTFERTVVFLLRSGNTDPRQGPFGLVINRPLQKRIKDMNPTNQKLATTFADCFLHFGGPLEASMFLLSTGESSQSLGLEMVIPGLCYGARNRLDEAAGLVKKGILKPQDFRFFVGYAGWQMNQLREEIESGFWVLAATSPNLIWESLSCSSSEGLWEEVLQLMGGQYAEISRKPKRNG